MFKKLLKFLFKDFYLFTCAYSNNIFPDPLTSSEEEKCIEGLKNNDKDCRNKLIEHNLRLVAHIVKKYDNKNNDVDDLISIGTIGLIKGIDSYSKNKSTKLTTYCAKCIENEILMYYRTNKKNNKSISLNESIGYDKEGNEITILDIIKTPTPDFVSDIQNKDDIILLKKYFNILTSREKEILIRRYGLNKEDEVTQKEIAKDLKISRSYVSRIEKRALTKILKEFIKNQNK